MYRPPVVLLVLAVTSFILSCGSSGSNRQLQSITITQTANGQLFQFVATGNLSGPPTTITPFPVEWSIQLMAPPPPQYTLTTQGFSFDCGVTGLTSTGPIPIVAYAPSDPNAPRTGSWSSARMIQASTVITCP